MQPLWYHGVGLHEVADGFEDGLEVVLLGLAAHDQVEARVDVVATFLHMPLGVDVVLARVEQDAERAAVRAADGKGLGFLGGGGGLGWVIVGVGGQGGGKWFNSGV